MTAEDVNLSLEYLS